MLIADLSLQHPEYVKPENKLKLNFTRFLVYNEVTVS